MGLCYCYIDECPCVLTCVPKFFKIKKSCENAVIDKIFVIKYVPDCNKTQKMWEKEVMGFPHPLQFIRDCDKTQKICRSCF